MKDVKAWFSFFSGPPLVGEKVGSPLKSFFGRGGGQKSGKCGNDLFGSRDVLGEGTYYGMLPGTISLGGGIEGGSEGKSSFRLLFVYITTEEAGPEPRLFICFPPFAW